MKIDKFISEFAEQFDETPAETFSAGTLFKENDEWSSMTALSIIAMVDDSYSVQLSGNDIRSSKTIQDIFDIVMSKADSN